MDSPATDLPATWPSTVPLAGRLRADIGLRRAAAALTGMLGIVFVVGVGAFLLLGAVPHGGFDPPGIVDHLGGLRDALAAPFARWDSVWYLTIARHGYTPGPSPAFFPLYPLLVAAVGSAGPGLLVGGVLVSVAAMLVALRLLWRLTDLELGAAAPGVADLAVLVVALGPMAFFFSAVYSESVFLALTLGAFLAARQEHWVRAGLLGGLAAATRSSGLVVVVGLLLLWLEQRHPSSRWARWPPGRALPPSAAGGVGGRRASAGPVEVGVARPRSGRPAGSGAAGTCCGSGSSRSACSPTSAGSASSASTRSPRSPPRPSGFATSPAPSAASSTAGRPPSPAPASCSPGRRTPSTTRRPVAIR